MEIDYVFPRKIFSCKKSARAKILTGCKTTLTFYRPMFPSHTNQSVDLFCKSIDWFLYDGNIGR